MQDRTPVFLTAIVVVERGQSEMLRELLACFQAQRSDDFEVLVVVRHRQDRAEIEGVVAQVPYSLGRRLIVVDGEAEGSLFDGVASFLHMRLPHVPHPVLEQARGLYFSIVRAGDVLFDNWSSVFKEAAYAHPGCIVHTHAFSQEWSAMLHGDAVWIQAEKRPEPVEMRARFLKGGTLGHACPSASLAFPLSMFSDLRITAQKVRCCGVEESSAATLISRVIR